MIEPAQCETPHLGISWLVQMSNDEAARRRLPAGSGRALWRLSNLRPGPLRNMGAMATRQDCRSRPSRHCLLARIRRLAARTHRLRPVARPVHHLCRPQAPETPATIARIETQFHVAGGTHRGPKRLALSEYRDDKWARDMIRAALKAGREHRVHRGHLLERESAP